MKTYSKKLAFSAIVIAVAMAACQKTEEGTDSQIQTLDNLTRAEGQAIQLNECGRSLNASSFALLNDKDKAKIEKRISASSDAGKYAAAGALFAVPKPIQSMFFAAKGVIKIVASVDDICSSAPLSAGEKAFASENSKDVHGCWDARSGHLEIYIKNDPKVIRHSLVRLLAHAYTDAFVTSLAANKNLPPEYKAQIEAGLARYEDQSKKLFDALVLDLKDKPEIANRLKRFEDSDAREARDGVVSEAIDSRYCSVLSDEAFRLKFPLTFRVFTQGPDAMGTEFGEPDHST